MEKVQTTKGGKEKNASKKGQKTVQENRKTGKGGGKKKEESASRGRVKGRRGEKKKGYAGEGGGNGVRERYNIRCAQDGLWRGRREKTEKKKKKAKGRWAVMGRYKEENQQKVVCKKDEREKKKKKIKGRITKE